MFRKVLLAIVLAIGVSCAYADAPDFDAIFKAQVAEAKKQVGVISRADVVKMIQEKQKFIIVDVREADEIKIFGKIDWPEQKNLSRGKLEPMLAKSGLKVDDKILVHCKTGARAALAAKTLKEFGFKNIQIIDGGMDKWLEENLPALDCV